MSEYIAKCKEFVGVSGATMLFPEYIDMNQEIVRCRDCEHYRKHKWFKVVVGTPLGTDISDVCMFFADGCKVDPDGYCAWAVKRKEGGDATR